MLFIKDDYTIELFSANGADDSFRVMLPPIAPDSRENNPKESILILEA
jgi:hypothetical protein